MFSVMETEVDIDNICENNLKEKNVESHENQESQEDFHDGLSSKNENWEIVETNDCSSTEEMDASEPQYQENGNDFVEDLHTSSGFKSFDLIKSVSDAQSLGNRESEEKDYWFEKPCEGDLPVMRFGAAGATFMNQVFVFGGVGPSGQSLVHGRCNTTYSLNTDSWQWKAVRCSGDIPIARSGHTLTCVDSELWLYGGETDCDGETGRRRVLGDVVCLNPQTRVWRKLSVKGGPPYWLLAPPRWGHSACLVQPYQIKPALCQLSNIDAFTENNDIFDQDDFWSLLDATESERFLFFSYITDRYYRNKTFVDFLIRCILSFFIIFFIYK